MNKASQTMWYVKLFAVNPLQLTKGLICMRFIQLDTLIAPWEENFGAWMQFTQWAFRFQAASSKKK